MKFLFSILAILVTTTAILTANTASLDSALSSGPGRYRLVDESVRLESLPSSVEEFTTMRNTLATNPKGGYAMFVAAMLTYVKNKDLGTKFFTLIMDMDALSRNPGNPLNVQGYVPNANALYLVRQLDSRLYLPAIYLAGTSVDNGYSYSLPASIEFRQATVRNAETVTLYALTTGGNSARPITLRKNDKGIWKAAEFSSVFVGASRVPQTRRTDTL